MDYKIKLQNITSNTDIVKIDSDGIAYALCQFIKNSGKDIFLHVVKNDARSSQIESQIKFFYPDLNILNFPAWDCLPYDNSSPKSQITADRIETLSFLSNETKNTNKTLIIATINALIQKTIPQNDVESSGFSFKVGDEVSLETVAKTLVKNGYLRSPNADNIGEFAIRGSIVDIIIQDQKSKEEQGYRLDFFGDNIETIRIFDPLTQISHDKVKKISFLQNKEIILNDKIISNFKNNYRRLFGICKNDLIYEGVTNGRSIAGIEHFMSLFYEENLSNIFEYLSNKNYQISLENDIESTKTEKLEEIEQYYQARIDTLKESQKDGNIYNPVPAKDLYLNQDDLRILLDQNQSLIRFDNFENQYFNRAIDLEFNKIPDFMLASKTNNRSAFDLMNDFIKSTFSKQKILIACNSLGSATRLEKILSNYEIATKIVQNPEEITNLGKNVIALSVFSLNYGFYCKDLAVISENSLVGEKKKVKKTTKISVNLIGESLGIAKGELIVHRYHGIGRFEGLQTITAQELTNDFLKLTYFGGDNLFLPVEDISLITRYGSDNPLIQLDKLGSSAWKNRSGKVRKRIKIAAEALIKIAALRKSKKAPILIPESGEYEEFKSRFEFVETQDQLSAIEEIEEDLTKGTPMDRLVCGDVGFGKTEVAMRAAFICAKNETKPFQVAIVTPTTLLCRQHYHNFLKRFENTGLKIAQLSRMVTPAQSRQIKQDLEDGKINIVIGTHAVLNKNIKFKNLGLVIIDEEQHFGVGQKERLKEFKNEVHILNLSATPIPRTLQMSLTGVKDLSLIATPPIDRIAIRSFVMDYDNVVIKEAIMREFHRGGKIFFVVPRIKDLEEILPKLEKLVPEVKVVAAHGQMTPAKLDEIMNNFYDDKFQLLLSTTIIESGIDIKEANTIIIHKAHMFGLSQLYQLRGRVGRGKIRAYAYLTTPPKRKLTDVATKKLQVMQTLDSLGAGFSVASHDMDIRGSGNILSDEQSGHVKETGVELYQDMLNEAINDLNSSNEQQIDAQISDYQAQIKLKISLLIPESYIDNLDLRMSFYKRISNIKSLEEKESLAIEMVDRFGQMPEEINNLLEVSYLKFLAKKCNIEKVEAKKDGILISFYNNHFEKPDELLTLVFSSNGKIKLQNHQILFLKPLKSSSEKLKFALEVVEKLLAV